MEKHLVLFHNVALRSLVSSVRNSFGTVHSQANIPPMNAGTQPLVDFHGAVREQVSICFDGLAAELSDCLKRRAVSPPDQTLLKTALLRERPFTGNPDMIPPPPYSTIPEGYPNTSFDSGLRRKNPRRMGETGRHLPVPEPPSYNRVSISAKRQRQQVEPASLQPPVTQPLVAFPKIEEEDDKNNGRLRDAIIGLQMISGIDPDDISLDLSAKPNVINV